MSIREGPWAPYQPTARDPWDVAKVAHLHRRAGLGVTRAELRRDRQGGPEASVRRLTGPPTPSEDERQVLEGLRQGVLQTGDLDRLKAWWLYRLLWGGDPLRETLTLFWHNHFATSIRKVEGVRLMLGQNELFRRHALGEFAALLTEVVGDPAMLVWLDGIHSLRQRPNENFAREFLELFTLGPGHYTERDIREAARAFTGWGRVTDRQFPDGLNYSFRPESHDDGEKTFLGRTGRWGSADIVRITLEQPACAEFLSRKLYRFLVSEAVEPGADLIRPLARELHQSRWSVRHVVGVILRSRHFYDPAVRRQRVASPVAFSAGLLRVLEVPRADVRLLALAAACDRQGQELFAPPNVRGWVAGRTWLNSTSLLERSNWCNDVLWGNPELGMARYDPLAWAQRNGVAPAEAAGALLELLLQGDLHPDSRAQILRAGQGSSADGLRRAAQLMCHCPEYQLV
jgi:uncharacterized protein (DUF1800 family)